MATRPLTAVGRSVNRPPWGRTLLVPNDVPPTTEACRDLDTGASPSQGTVGVRADGRFHPRGRGRRLRDRSGRAGPLAAAAGLGPRDAGSVRRGPGLRRPGADAGVRGPDAAPARPV